MICTHCWAKQTTHPSGWCSACRIFLDWLRQLGKD